MRLAKQCAVIAIFAMVLAGCGGEGGDGGTGEGTGGGSSGGGIGQGPAATISAQPAPVTKDPFASLTFAASGATRFECSLDGAAATACESPHLVFPLDPGEHRLTVTAFDTADRAGDPATARWTVSSIFGDAFDNTIHPELIRTTQQPSAVAPNSWRGILRLNCDFSHSAYDDPVVYPGQAGRAHLHRFYGNTRLDHTSTVESLLTGGESSCQGNTLNRSAYWIPAVLAPSYNPTTGARLTDGNGDPAWKVVPGVVGNDDVAHEIFYYSAGVSDLASIRTIPLGLKMIAGDHMGMPGMAQDTAIARWHCQSWESSDGANPRWSASIPQCSAPDRVRMDLFFPSCWNGRDLDSADHKSHMAYPVTSGGRSECPASHPVPIVRVSYHYAFGVLPDVYDPATRSSRGWRMASDMYSASTTTPGGMSLHGDWINAWHPEALAMILSSCIQRGLDCHDGNLANGFRLSGTRPGTQASPAIVNEGRGGG